MLPSAARVRAAVRETEDTVTLEIEPPAGYVFAPGQFNMLYAHGVGEAAISVSGASDDGRILHTVREVGATSRALCRLAPGGALGMRGPFGASWPLEAAEEADVIFVAGGLGLAPLRPAVRLVASRRERYRRAAVLIGAREPGQVLFASEHGLWRASGIEVHVTVDHAPPAWTGDVGVVTKLFDRLDLDPRAAHAFVCGPEIMMRFAGHGLRERGVRAERIWLSMERNMKCAIGLCGHCQFGPDFICRDGPVLPYSRIAVDLARREI